MPNATINQLKRQWTDKSVCVESSRADFARFDGMVGRVVTVNENGQALVDFGDGPWYDIPLADLTMQRSDDS